MQLLNTVDVVVRCSVLQCIAVRCTAVSLR